MPRRQAQVSVAIALTAGILVIPAVFQLLAATHTRSGTEPVGVSPALGKALASIPSVAPSSAAAASPAAAPSWKGTELDGDIHLDSAGHVIPDLGLRRLFDYLLTGSAQIGMSQIKQYLNAQLRERSLTAGQSAEVMSFFDRYQAYLSAAEKSPQSADSGRSADADSLRAEFEKRNELRREMLGLEMEDGFFGESEREDQAALDRLAVMKDPSLSEAERKNRLQAIRASEPLPMQESERNAELLQDLAAQTELLKKSGANDGQILAMRSQLVGEAAAERLQQTDLENAEWNQRMDALRQEQKQISDTPGLSQQDKSAEVEAIIARDFTATEAIRARALLGVH